jgi:phage tail-like protein
MSEPTANSAADPYTGFKFRITWDGRCVGAVNRVSALTRPTSVVTHRQSGDPSAVRKSPGQSGYGPITLERGITCDVEFEQWANKVWDYHNSDDLGHEVSLADFRKDIGIELYNIAGQKVLGYIVSRCWPSAFVALPELDATANAVAIQSLTLENEGWQREPFTLDATDPASDSSES